MNTFLFCLVAVCAVSYLLIQINRRDPFADENMRSLLFPGFRTHRVLAKTGFLLITGGLLVAGSLATLSANAVAGMLAALLAIYFVTGTLVVLREIDKLTYQSRSIDPVLHGIALLLTWPVWKSRYRLRTRTN